MSIALLIVMVLPSRDIGKGMMNHVIKILGKDNMLSFSKLEIKQDINEIISDKITYRIFKKNNTYV